MENYRDIHNDLLATFFTPGEIEKLSIPQIRLLEDLEFEPMPNQLLYLDDDLRPRNPEHEHVAAPEDHEVHNNEHLWVHNT